MKRYIVTGGLGHIGSHVVDALVERGDEVVIIDDLSAGLLLNKNPRAVLLPVNVLEAHQEPVIVDGQFDGIFHLAAFAAVRASNENPLLAARSGANLTLAMLELALLKHIRKMVFISSVVVRTNPGIPYGIEKVASERYCEYFTKQFGVDSSIIRLHNVYGSPRHHLKTGNVIPAFFDQKNRLGMITISGDGSQQRDFVHYTDVVRAILEAEHRLGITEIGTGQGVSMLQVAEYFSCPVEFVGKPTEEVDIQICERSDYETRISFEDGMKRLFGLLK